MTTDESGSKDQTESGSPDSVSEPSETKEERSSRMNAAKAFYRAMYAGEDVDPEAFGMGGPQGAGGTGGGGGDSRDRGPCPSCARMEAQVQEAQNKQLEAENYYKRIAADFENYRRRTEKERDEFMMNGIQKAIEAILPALDDLDRAKSSLSNVTDPKQITESLNLVFQRFGKCLEGLGVKPLEVIGTPFDPRLHEPVQEIETQEFPDGVVMHELRRGYAFKEKTLRPSLVNVASNPSGVVVPAQTAGAKDQQEEAKPEEKDASAATGEPPSEAKEESALAESKTGHEETKSEEAHKEKESKPPRRKASSQDRNFDATATADLPVFQVDESMMLNIDPESEAEKTVYDISDAEEMDEVT
jgi:molecular chaperone GrpE